MQGGARNCRSPYRHPLAVTLDATATLHELSTGLGTTLAVPTSVDAPVVLALRHLAAAVVILLRAYVNGALDAAQPKSDDPLPACA